MSFGVNQNIFGLEISMNDVDFFVQVLQPQEDFSTIELCFFKGESVKVFKIEAEISASYVFHTEITIFFILKSGVKFDNERIFADSENFLLGDKLSKCSVSIGKSRLWNSFESIFLSIKTILSKINFSKTTHTNNLDKSLLRSIFRNHQWIHSRG